MPKPQHPRSLRVLMRSLKDFLSSGKHQVALKHFYTSLDALDVDNATRFIAYENVILLFLQHGHPLSAAMVYSRMTSAGFLPSVSIRTQMSLVALAQRSPSESELLQFMEQHFAHKSFDERCLRDVLHLLVDSMGSSPEFLDKVMQVFTTLQSPGYTLSSETSSLLVRVHARVGRKETAQRWLLQSPSTTPHLYTTFLRSYIASAPGNADAVYKWILEQIRNKTVLPDKAFYNVLIATEVARLRYNQAFAIYSLMLQHRMPTIHPDAYTFSTLFRALRRMRRPRSVRTRRLRISANVLTGRQLFRQMLDCFYWQSSQGGQGANSSAVITHSSLHHALRYFMSVHDYSAAFLALRTLRICHLKPSLHTYRVVLSPLLRRIETELQLLPRAVQPDRYWAYRFVGMGTYPVGQSVAYGVRLLIEVLRIGAVPKLSLDYIPSPECDLERNTTKCDARTDGSPGLTSVTAESSVPPDLAMAEIRASVQLSQQHNMPSALQIVGIEESESDDEFGITPLERILRRAILAGRPSIDSTPATEVSAEIAEAKDELFDSSWDKKRRSAV